MQYGTLFLEIASASQSKTLNHLFYSAFHSVLLQHVSHFDNLFISSIFIKLCIKLIHTYYTHITYIHII